MAVDPGEFCIDPYSKSPAPRTISVSQVHKIDIEAVKPEASCNASTCSKNTELWLLLVKRARGESPAPTGMLSVHIYHLQPVRHWQKIKSFFVHANHLCLKQSTTEAKKTNTALWFLKGHWTRDSGVAVRLWLR